jgi:hypothetical protein
MQKLDHLEESEEEYEAEQEELRIESSAYEAETPKNLSTSILLSVTYSGKYGKALVKLYNPEDGKVYYWYDNTGT